MSIGLYIVLAPLYLKSVRKLQEKRFVFVKILAIIIPENGAKVSKIKCFQFAQQTLNNIESLIVYSTVLARVAKHEKNVLDLFKKEVKSMNDLANEKDIFNVVKTDEVEALKEDVDYINSKINK